MRPTPESRRGPVLSIRWIVTGVTILLTASSVLVVGAVYDQHAQQELHTQVQERTLLLARNLALSSADPLLSDFPELTLHPLVKELLANNQELAFAVVVDHEGRTQGHEDARALGGPYRPLADLEPVTTPGSQTEGTLWSNDDVLVAEVSVHDLTGRPIGRTLVGLNRSYIDGLLFDTRRQLVLVAALVVVLGVTAAFVLMSGLLRPVAALRAGLTRIGHGNLDEPISVRDRTELGLLADTVNDMAAELRHAQAEMIERERLAHEVSLARRLQQSLLPKKPAVSHGVTVMGWQRAAAEVGGDYYDILPLEDGRIALAIADVSGKGLAGCMVMTMVSSLLRAYRDIHDSPSALLVALDERLTESLEPGVFVTMFYGILDPVRGELVFASAGHNPMLVYRQSSGQVETITSPGIPLAAIRNGAILSTLKNQTVQLEPGDTLVEYTDGFSEAPSQNGGEELGLERLQRVVLETAHEGPKAVLESLSRAVHQWTGSETPRDDETLLVVSRSGAAPVPEAASESTARSEQEAIAALEEARAMGHRLVLPARLDAMADVLHWIGELEDLRHLGGKDAKILGTALYEACANVVEHGYGEDESQSLELWWVPPPVLSDDDALIENAAVRAASIVRRGRFVMRDHGRAFRPDSWEATDFGSPDTWKKRRGFGLDILHRAMRHVTYQPSTLQGNVTLLTYGPRMDHITSPLGDLQ